MSAPGPHRRLAIAAVALAALAVGCSAGDDPSGSATTTTTAAAPATTATTAGTEPTTTAGTSTDPGTSVPASTTAPVPSDGSPSDVAAAFLRAMEEDDAAAACALVHPDGFSNLGTDESTCVDDFHISDEQRRSLAGVEVVGQTEECDSSPDDVDATSVQVRLEGDGDCISMARHDGRWLIEDL